ncbi:MAG: YebC/PmpR family DNA-binding transcriptional regulator [Candidatus Moraniibacteriota bacterium]|nr:MAG: YebC/PmpR family DNA-binding transcriptional regulator [Candidatus Moranbacteria bacterium]
MSGHSHWATTHRAKGVNDAKRAAIFTKAGRNIILAAERGGGNPDSNYLLKIAITEARALNMPKDRIERAILRGTGELVGEKIESIMYEGFGPGQVALLIETTTDNRNRTVSELRSLCLKKGGKLGNSGSVAFLFQRVGLLAFEIGETPLEKLEELAIESGAQDYAVSDNIFTVYTEVDKLQAVQAFFENQKLTPTAAQLGWKPTQTVTLDTETQKTFGAFLEELEDHQDVQAVWNNLN